MISFGAAPDYDLGGMEGTGARGADTDALRAGRQPQQQRERDASMGLPMPLPRSTSTNETAQAYSIVPGPIKNFIEFFYRAIITGVFSTRGYFDYIISFSHSYFLLFMGYRQRS